MKQLFPQGPFLTSRRKLLDLLILLVLDTLIYVFWSSWETLVLFTFGFIWNWVASQELSNLIEHRRYRFSMVKLVKNLEIMILKPIESAPSWVKWVAKILPAGIFWSMVIYFNEAKMPWWSTFLGSLTFELIQLEMKSFRRERESSP